jgi:vesicle-associated membrane protein-associated protein A
MQTETAYDDAKAEPTTEVQDSVPEAFPLPVPVSQLVVPTTITAVPVVSAPITEPPTREPPEPTPVTPVIITRENPFNEELYAKYHHAQMEIERLKEQVTSLSELRRRPRAISDDGSTVGSDIQTMVEESPIHQEGVPLQVVVIIAFGVFVMTYLFF